MAVMGSANTELIVPNIAAKDNATVVGAWRYTSDRKTAHDVNATHVDEVRMSMIGMADTVQTAKDKSSDTLVSIASPTERSRNMTMMAAKSDGIQTTRWFAHVSISWTK